MSLVLNVEILGEFKKLTQATKGAETALGKLNKTTSSIGKKMSGTLAAIGVGFSLTAVTRGIGDTLEAASDLEQQFGALDSIFKHQSQTMQEFAYSLSPIGLSAADAARSMALLGSQLKGYGLPIGEASKKTQELTQLAADLAATFGGTTYGAVESISALFRGEYDPIEKYGVAIKKSDVNARLAAEGLDGLEGQALKLAEAQAALNLLFEKTTDAQGQAAREANSYASQQAFLKAETENLKAQIGEALLPVMVELFTQIRDNLPEIKAFLETLIQFIPVVVDLAIKAFDYKEQLLAISTALGVVKVAMGAVSLAASPMNLAFANPYFLGAAVVLGGIAAGMATVYSNTKKATTAVEEFNRVQSLKEKQTEIQTPEQIAADTFEGIIPQLTPVTPSIPKKGGVSNAPSITNNTTIVVEKPAAKAADIVKAIDNYNKQTGGGGGAVMLR